MLDTQCQVGGPPPNRVTENGTRRHAKRQHLENRNHRRQAQRSAPAGLPHRRIDGPRRLRPGVLPAATRPIARREGWETDRGRIYIIYGHPDQLEDWPYSPNARPYQEWHYYRDGRYKRFLFIDKNEDGEYRLAYPYDGLYQRPDF
ncbi:MAG: GWxTD domain-containing protein [Planctomycetes bacterium]|nr:GWxTD domain-containing protein [Planctomycetota bacterium]